MGCLATAGDPPASPACLGAGAGAAGTVGGSSTVPMFCLSACSAPSADLCPRGAMLAVSWEAGCGRASTGLLPTPPRAGPPPAASAVPGHPI